MNGCVVRPDFAVGEATLPLSLWVLDAANRAIAEATQALENFRLGDYAHCAYRFVWGDFCDWFLELAKPNLAEDGPEARELRAVAAHVLGLVLRLLHPVIPFVTEALWGELGYGALGGLITAPWPVPEAIAGAEAARAELGWVIGFISAIRAVRSEMNVPAASRIPVLLRDAGAPALAWSGQWQATIARLARVTSIAPLTEAAPHGSVQVVLDELTIILPLADLVDLGAERTRLQTARARAAGDIEKISQKLANQDFIGRAPEAIITENQDRLKAAQSELARVDAALAQIPVM